MTNVTALQPAGRCPHDCHDLGIHGYWSSGLYPNRFSAGTQSRRSGPRARAATGVSQGCAGVPEPPQERGRPSGTHDGELRGIPQPRSRRVLHLRDRFGRRAHGSCRPRRRRDDVRRARRPALRSLPQREQQQARVQPEPAGHRADRLGPREAVLQLLRDDAGYTLEGRVVLSRRLQGHPGRHRPVAPAAHAVSAEIRREAALFRLPCQRGPGPERARRASQRLVLARAPASARTPEAGSVGGAHLRGARGSWRAGHARQGVAPANGGESRVPEGGGRADHAGAPAPALLPGGDQPGIGRRRVRRQETHRRDSVGVLRRSAPRDRRRSPCHARTTTRLSGSSSLGCRSRPAGPTPIMPG